MGNPDFQSDFISLSVNAAHAIRRVVNGYLAAFGLTFSQWVILRRLTKEGVVCQKQLAYEFECKPSTLSGLILRLAKGGWLECCYDSADKRRKILRPTARFLLVREDVEAGVAAILQRALRGCSHNEIQSAMSALQSVWENVCQTSRMPR